MSRIRSIHPGLWTDEAFVCLSGFARLLYIGLWNECDDKGIFPWSPLQMKMRLLPADNVDAGELLAEIEAAGCVMRYEMGGKKYGAVRNFAKFQRPKKPNNIHPATALVLAFAGHDAEPEALDDASVGEEFPTASELPPQMEEGGDKMEEEEELAPDGACPSDDEPVLRPEHIFEQWNTSVANLGKPKVRDLTPERRQLLRSRIRQYSIDDFLDVFGKIERSPFLRGETGWHGCNFDWVFKKANFQKILEGNYDQ